MSNQILTDTMDGTRKKEDHVKEGRTRLERI
jgi:hypothetical protein